MTWKTEVKSGASDGLRSPHQERHADRRHGRAGAVRGRGHRRRAHRRDRRCHGKCEQGDRRRRPGGRARIHRSAHALRRADLLGRRGDAVVLARRDLGRDGQLRRRHRALPPRSARDRDAGPRQRGSDPVRGARPGHHLGLGELPAVSGRRRGTQALAQPRLPRAAHALPPLRHGRGFDGAGRIAGGDGRDQGAARRGDGRRRLRLFQHAPQPAPGLRRPPARLPQREPRGIEGLRQRAPGTGQGRDRDRADAADRRAGGRRARAARLAARRERAPDHLHRHVRPRRPARSGARRRCARRRR